MIITFTILGNQKDANANAMPYKRTTQRGKFSESYQAYQDWQEVVRDAFSGASMPADFVRRAQVAARYGGKPIQKGTFKQARLCLDIAFRPTKNGKCNHGDPTNIVKGIEDALFEDDSHVLAHVRSLDCASPAGQVRVRISL